jgi:hypothetical protein
MPNRMIVHPRRDQDLTAKHVRIGREQAKEEQKHFRPDWAKYMRADTWWL